MGRVWVLLAFGTAAEPLEGQDAGVHQRGWPAAWFQAPRTASEAGIRRFAESSYVANLSPAKTRHRLPNGCRRLPSGCRRIR